MQIGNRVRYQTGIRANGAYEARLGVGIVLYISQGRHARSFKV
jgi:hypothetical protein